jgi:hypothetical protein
VRSVAFATGRFALVGAKWNKPPSDIEDWTMGSRRVNAKKKEKRRAHSANRKAQAKVAGDKSAERDRKASRPQMAFKPVRAPT